MSRAASAAAAASAGPGGRPRRAPATGTGGRAGLPGDGGGLGGNTSDTALLDYLVANRGTATWIVAADSAQEAGSIELATGLPVMAMGGFTGSDPAPTLAQLESYIASGKLRFVIAGGGSGSGFGGGGGFGGWRRHRRQRVGHLHLQGRGLRRLGRPVRLRRRGLPADHRLLSGRVPSGSGRSATDPTSM